MRFCQNTDPYLGHYYPRWVILEDICTFRKRLNSMQLERFSRSAVVHRERLRIIFIVIINGFVLIPLQSLRNPVPQERQHFHGFFYRGFPVHANCYTRILWLVPYRTRTAAPSTRGKQISLPRRILFRTKGSRSSCLLFVSWL
jgi:hypothetical protein